MNRNLMFGQQLQTMNLKNLVQRQFTHQKQKLGFVPQPQTKNQENLEQHQFAPQRGPDCSIHPTGYHEYPFESRHHPHSHQTAKHPDLVTAARIDWLAAAEPAPSGLTGRGLTLEGLATKELAPSKLPTEGPDTTSRTSWLEPREPAPSALPA